MIQANLTHFLKQLTALETELLNAETSANEFEDTVATMDRAADSLETRQINSLLAAIDATEQPILDAMAKLSTIYAATEPIEQGDR